MKDRPGPTRPTAAILDYDAGNVRSAKRGFDAAGVEATVTGDPDAAAASDLLVIPGVGNFDSCLAQLRRSGLVTVVETFIAEQRPVFGICVGMQLLYEGSDEGEQPGLGLLPGHVHRLPVGSVVPHMGWDVIRPADGAQDDPLLAGVASQRMYFVHGYYAVPRDPSHVVAQTAYGGVNFPCVVREGSVVGTQFHPEKSGAAGTRMLTNWVASAT